MAWTFGDFRLDPERFELSHSGTAVQLEPQVLALLVHLIRNRDRMVTKDEIAADIWQGRDVSDASISSRIRSARHVVGDDGATQTVIRTVHGRGYRFVAEVVETQAAVVAEVEPASEPPNLSTSRPSIAILPFTPLAMSPDQTILADAIPHEIIQALSRLRWLAVIARGSSFRFRQSASELDLVATALGARYLLSGIIETHGNGLGVTLELVDSSSSEVIWGDRLVAPVDAIDDLRGRIVAHLVSALEVHIPLNEARTARLGGIETLDAWANYHLGLHHLYRFTASGNAQATQHFGRAITLDPRFARAHAGLSFTSFLDAFLHLGGDDKAATQAARRHAERGLELDPLDPFANFTMGRSYWLTDEPETALDWLTRATTLNPNYAQGFYASAFTSMVLGRGTATVVDLDTALHLSPLDPLLYGIHAVRAQILIQNGDYEAAARWGDRAAATPGAHYLVVMIALVANSLAARHDQAGRWRQEVKRRKADASAAQYFASFPTRDTVSRRLIAEELRRHGF
ncbi:MAG: winged helix-turn-helix domain-containing protein [bacterium]